MSDTPAVTFGDVEAEFDEFRELVQVLRRAVNDHLRAKLVSSGKPFSPAILMGALLHEASNVAVMWGTAQNLRPDDIEATFNHAVRQAKRALHGGLHAADLPDSTH